MGHRLWLAPSGLVGGAASVLLVARVARGDHGDALRAAPMDPVTVGILVFVFVLAVCLLIGIVTRLLLRRARSME